MCGRPDGYRAGQVARGNRVNRRAAHAYLAAEGAPIFAATDNAVMARQLTLAWGVIPVLCGSMQGDVSDEAYRIGQMLVDDGSIPKGSVIVLVSITPELARGSSNFLKLQRV